MAAVLYIPDPLLSSRVARGRRRTEERDEVSLTQTNRCGVETSHRACRKKMPRAPGNAFQRVVDSSHGLVDKKEGRVLEVASFSKSSRLCRKRKRKNQEKHASEHR